MRHVKRLFALRLPRQLAEPCEPVKTGLVLFYLFLAASSNWAVLAFTHDRVGRVPLPDLVFQLIPEQVWAIRLGDVMVSLCSCSFFLLLAFHRRRFVVLRRVGFIGATLYVMRSVCLIFTQLPPGYENNDQRCREQSPPSIAIWLHRFLEQFITIGFQDSTGTRMLCGDLLFSGHTIVLMVCSQTVAYYLPKTWHPLHYLPRLFALIGMCCLLLSRTHYTVDVLIALWLTVLLFQQYHAFIELEHHERRHSALHFMGIFWIVTWLEQNVDSGRNGNKFEWPLQRRDDRVVPSAVMISSPAQSC